MNKIKSMFFLSLCLLLVACNSTLNENFVDWNEDAKYNSSYNDWSDFYSIYETEEGIITYRFISDENGSNVFYYPLYINNDEIVEMNNDISSTCSFNNPWKCDNLIPLTAIGYDSGVFYYKGKIYYFSGEMGSDGSYYDIFICSANLDGSNQKKEYTLGTYPNLEDESYHSAYIQFHRNKLYANFHNQLFIADLGEGKIFPIEFSGVKDVWKIFMCEDIMYLTTEEYNDGKKVYYNALLKCDLEGNLLSVESDDEIVLFVDDTIKYYATEQEKGYNFYILNKKTNKLKDLGNVNYQYALKYEGNYLFDTGTLGIDKSQIMIIDKELNVIHVKDYTNDEYWNDTPLFVGNRYYVIKYTKNHIKGWYGYYEITEEGISDIVEFPKME